MLKFTFSILGTSANDSKKAWNSNNEGTHLKQGIIAEFISTSNKLWKKSDTFFQNSKDWMFENKVSDKCLSPFKTWQVHKDNDV